MRKTSLITAILLLSAVWAVAQTSPSSSPQSTTPGASSQQQPTSPSSTSPSQQPAAPDASSTTTQTTQTSSDSGNSIEGCLNGSAGNWTLTDQSGKTYQLSGDTSKLSDHVGHQVRIMGTDNSSSASSSGSAGSSPSSSATGAGASSGSQPTFTVQKVKMISSTCPTSK
jgi:hypothetical protein